MEKEPHQMQTSSIAARPCLRTLLRWVAFYRPGRIACIERAEHDPAECRRWLVIVRLSDDCRVRIALLTSPDTALRCQRMDDV
jgi:hypothetical protein